MNSITIQIGDYIASDFFSPIQGFVKSIGMIGRQIPGYVIETIQGKTEYIIKGQANLLWTKEEWDNPEKRDCHYPRHD